MAVAVVNWRQLLAPQNILSGATVLCGATSVVWRDFQNRVFCWRHNMAPYTAKSAKLNRHKVPPEHIWRHFRGVAPLPTAIYRIWRQKIKIWRLTTAMADLPNGANFWRQLAMSPIGDAQVSENLYEHLHWRHWRQVDFRQLAPIGANWRSSLVKF